MEIGRALRRLRARKATQEAIATLLGVTQGTVSQWETGRSSPTFEQMQTIEKHLGFNRGAILVSAGLVSVVGVEASILADPALEPEDRDLVLGLYRGVVQQRAQRRKGRK